MHTSKFNKKILLFLLLILFSNNAVASESLKKLNASIPFPNLAILNSKEKPFIFDFEKNSTSEGYVINFWATWCRPCKEEMPSLDALKTNPSLDNIEIFPINIGKDNLKKSEQFFEDLNIKNLKIYFDNPITLAKNLNLRGIPTTVLFDKNGKEFGRIIGSIDFKNKEFLQWIKKYN